MREKLLAKKRWIIAIIVILLLVCLIVASQTVRLQNNANVFQRAAYAVLTPVRIVSNGAINKFNDLIGYFSNVNALQSEKEDLYKQIYELQSEVNRLKENGYENERLKDLLDMHASLSVEWEPDVTVVIGRSPNYWLNTITIQGGKDKGYKENMPVVNGKGLVGRITAVFENTSKVVLITDKEGAVAAMLQDSRTVGVVEKSTKGEHLLEMIHVPYDAKVSDYQVVITSGLGGIYPKGLLIGYVDGTKQESGGLMQTLSIVPFVDFNKLEEVMVLLPKENSNGNIGQIDFEDVKDKNTLDNQNQNNQNNNENNNGKDVAALDNNSISLENKVGGNND